MKKFLFIFILTISIFFTNLPIYASTIPKTKDNEFPYSVETVIDDTSIFSISPYSLAVQNSNKTITKTKTTRTKAQDGTVLWTVSITATFNYNSSTSKCISCSHSATSYARTWSIKSVTSSKSGNSATATAIATHSNGNLSHDFSQSVTIECSKNGIVS